MGTQYLQYASAAFAFAAAVLWILSATVKIPRRIQHLDFGSVVETETKTMDDADRLTEGLWKQSRLSAAAAGCAAIAAMLQGLAIAC